MPRAGAAPRRRTAAGSATPPRPASRRTGGPPTPPGRRGRVQHQALQAQPRALPGRHHPVHPLRPQLRHARRRRPHRRADVLRLPGGVGPRLVQEVLPVLRPGPVRILRDVQQRRLPRRHHRPPLGAVLLAPLPVVRLKVRQVRGREERQTEAGRAPRRRLRGAPDEQQRVRPGEGPRGDPYRTAPVRERLARPRREEGLQELVLEPPAPPPVDPALLVLLRPVADPRHRHEPAAAQQVEHRDLLREPQRVVQRADDRRDRDRDPAGRAEDRARQGEGGGEPVVLHPVVLLGLDGVHPVPVGVRGHVQDGPVALRQGLGGGAGLDEVEPYDGEGHGVPSAGGLPARGDHS